MPEPLPPFAMCYSSAPRFPLLQFEVAPGDLESKHILVGGSWIVPDSGLIQKFREALQPYRGLREIKPEERMAVFFWEVTEKELRPWGQIHKMLIQTSEVLVNERYSLIARALGLLRHECEANGVTVDLKKLSRVSVRFDKDSTEESVSSPVV
jgi:hypothetical protein